VTDLRTTSVTINNGGSSSDPLILNKLIPKKLDGSDLIGCFNGAACAEKNLGDFGVSVTATGTEGSLAEMTGCTLTSNSPVAVFSCSGSTGIADFQLAANKGKTVAVPGGERHRSAQRRP